MLSSLKHIYIYIMVARVRCWIYKESLFIKQTWNETFWFHAFVLEL